MTQGSEYKPKTRNPVIGIRVEPEVKKRLHDVAEREMIPAGTLARVWIIKALKAKEAEHAKEDAEDAVVRAHAAVIEGRTMAEMAAMAD